MIRTKQNEDLIEEIEGGIKKEVSVSCAIAKASCSICGSDMKEHRCEHIRGKSYCGELCFALLENATDAYEWSFVAVPAQREAGVTKSFEKSGGESAVETVKSAVSGINLSAEQVRTLKLYIERLEKAAEASFAYRAQLLAEIEKYASIIMPGVEKKSFLKGFESMEINELKNFSSQLKKQAGSVFPIEPQLKPIKDNTKENNEAFKI